MERFPWQYETVRDDAFNRSAVFAINERKVRPGLTCLGRHSYFFRKEIRNGGGT